tara:strand:+ start:150 stop:488 length:339 start_codon:yes stop_codon:yes gene_type:complete
LYQELNLEKDPVGIKKDFPKVRREIIRNTIDKDGQIMAEDDKNFTIVNGEKVPVYNAKVVQTIKNKRTGKVYKSKLEFDHDVSDTSTDTTEDDLQQDVAIEVDSLRVFGKTK